MTDCHCETDPCPCFGEGYAAGKDKAFFEVRHLDGHAAGCGCDPCRVIARVLGTVSLDSEAWVREVMGAGDEK